MVVLLDLRLPGLSGQRVLTQLLEMENSPSVLVLSGDDDENTQVDIARCGARGFLPKRDAVNVLARAIRTVSKGEMWFSQKVSSRIFQEHHELVRRVRNQERPLNQLTEREKEVLARVARGLTNRQIAAELFMSIHTVKLHIQNILRKLGLPNRTEAAVYAVREGLMEDGSEPSEG
jgi:DNA-binding NarL/FixJ family response regulator